MGERERAAALIDRVAIAMAYDGERGGWTSDMTEFGKGWWRDKAKQALLSVRAVIGERGAGRPEKADG
jgi:hypothetical protein